MCKKLRNIYYTITKGGVKVDKETILIVDDDKHIVEAVSKLLQINNFNTLKAYNGEECIKLLKQSNIDLILMDVMMPKMDGFMTLQQIRADKNIPIIMLSAKTEANDKVVGLQLGADDYISKPYNPQALVARVSANIRRYKVLNNVVTKRLDNKHILTVDILQLYTESKQLYVNEQLVKLTPKEYGVIELLMKSPGRVFSIREIYNSVWEDTQYISDNTVMVHIRRLRKKIEINPKEAKYLKVVWGIGYKIERY